MTFRAPMVLETITPESLRQAMAGRPEHEQSHLSDAVRYMEHHGMTQVCALGNIVDATLILPDVGQYIRIPKGVTMQENATGICSIATHSLRSRVLVVKLGMLWCSNSERADSIVECPLFIIVPGPNGNVRRIAVRDWFEKGGRVLKD